MIKLSKAFEQTTHQSTAGLPPHEEISAECDVKEFLMLMRTGTRIPTPAACHTHTKGCISRRCKGSEGELHYLARWWRLMWRDENVTAEIDEEVR